MYHKIAFVFAALMIALGGNAFGQDVPPGGWTDDATIGTATPGNSVSPSKGVYEVTGNGNDIWGTADAGQYLYKELVGDGTMTARVVDNGTGSNTWAKGGVMIRQSADAGSQHAFTCITGSSGGGSAFQRRIDTDGASTSNHDLAGGPYAAPYWVRIERVGDDFTGFLSEDGQTWAQAGDVMTIDMQDPVLIGLAVTSHAAGELRTYVFDNISFTGDVSGEKDPGAAGMPSPADEAVDVPRDSILSWTAGDYPGTHDVYLGTVFDDVNDASRVNPRDVLVSQGQSDPAYTPPVVLDFGQTYYWRVDEVNSVGSAIFKGDVWSFTVEPFAYAVENVVAISNAISEEGAGIDKTIDGSGLNENDEHSTESTDMWLGLPNGADPITIQYDFDQVYKMHEMRVWNYNVMFELMLGFGLKDVTVEYSANGTDWTVLGDVELAQGTAMPGYTANTAVDLQGVPAQHIKLTVNSGWGPMGQFGLSEVRFMYIPAQPREPQPADDAIGVDVSSIMSWRAGREAATHDVYFSTDEAAVADGSALADSTNASTFTPAGLDFGMRYYWKVVEVNEADAITAWEGPVWSFATQEYAVIDDFESYDDEDNRIYDAWLDGFVNGTGSTVGYFEAPFAEQTVVNSGAQSMPLAYDNSAAPFYSEAEFDLGSLSLTGNGADTLRLFVAGQAPAFLEAADGSITMNAIGVDIWGTADEFRYAYKTLSGNGSMTVRVDYLDASPNGWVKAGVMIRQNTDAGSVNAFTALTGGSGDGATFQWRDTADAASASSRTLTGIAPPYFVRIVRQGNTFTGYLSADGQTWEQQGTDSIDVTMTDPVLIGLALTSHNANQATSATFSDITIEGNVSAGWQMAEVGVAQPAGNAPESVYVALEDTSGKTAVATAEAATAQPGWTEWTIPYSDLTGVNLSRVAIMYLGVGNRDNPTAGGTGTIFIDDIGFGHPEAPAGW